MFETKVGRLDKVFAADPGSQDRTGAQRNAGCFRPLYSPTDHLDEWAGFCAQKSRARICSLRFDAIADKMYRQIERFKGRRLQSRRRDAAAAAAAVDLAATELPEETTQIVRTKQFVAQPMNPEEAAEQMELLGHDFFIFYNVETSSLNIVYGRRGRPLRTAPAASSLSTCKAAANWAPQVVGRLTPLENSEIVACKGRQELAAAWDLGHNEGRCRALIGVRPIHSLRVQRARPAVARTFH